VVAAVAVALAAVGVLRRSTGGVPAAWHKALYVTLLAADRPGRSGRRPDGAGRNDSAAGPVATAEPIAVGAAS
jgi:hypothetical protein